MKTFLKHAYTVAMLGIIALVLAIVLSGTLAGCRTVKQQQKTKVATDSTGHTKAQETAVNRLDSTHRLQILDSGQKVTKEDFELETIQVDSFDAGAWHYGLPVKRITTTRQRGTLATTEHQVQKTTQETNLHKTDTASRSSDQKATLHKTEKHQAAIITRPGRMPGWLLWILILVAAVVAFRIFFYNRFRRFISALDENPFK